MRVLAIHEAAIGGTSSASIEAQHAMKVGFLTSAAALFVAHNHPSGDPRPSGDDRMMFESMKDTIRCAGMQVLDSLVIARDGWSSISDGDVYRWR